MSQPTEQIYTMQDYYDGPRGGVADYNGKPHVYRSLWADIDRARSDIFELMPIDAETLALALESWAIWIRWRAAFDRGETDLETHPALPADRKRHEELEAQLDRLLAIESPAAITATGNFDWSPQKDNPLHRPVGVRWSLVDRPLDCVVVEG